VGGGLFHEFQPLIVVNPSLLASPATREGKFATLPPGTGPVGSISTVTQEDALMSKAKRDLRDRVASELKAMLPVERLERSARVQARLMATPEFKNARSVMVYQSDQTEVDTREIVMACLDEGKRVSLPRTVRGTRTMEALEILDVKRDLEDSRFGFKEPQAILPFIALENIDLVVVPGRAFDAEGHRLGRGGGYYDRFLSLENVSAARAAVAFDLQIVEAVPCESHDCLVDLVVTETRVIRKSG
jgi:5-formyltetrahydrofolate cyclo-ligase